MLFQVLHPSVEYITANAVSGVSHNICLILRLFPIKAPEK